MLTETKLTARLVKAWREAGGEILNIMGGGYMQAPGWPDVFVCHKLWSGWLEIKGPKTKIQPTQERIIKALSVTQNAWIVRIVHQDSNQWTFDILGSGSTPLSIVGTDGFVAISLLKELARLGI